MATSNASDNPDELNINLREAAAAYEAEQQIDRLASEIERYSPELLSLLADAAGQQVDKGDFATRVHQWSDQFGDSDEIA